MKILGIYSEDYPWDVRIEKILGGLAAQGHGVDLVCRNLKRSATEEQVGPFHCRRVLDASVGPPWQSTLSIPAPINPVWKRAIRRGITDGRPDLVVVRDLPLAPLAISEARRAGLPCLVDMAENHPEMWRQVCRNDRWKIPSYLMKNPGLAKKMEVHVARTADTIFVVVSEMRDHLLSLGADPERVHIVSNTPDLSSFTDAVLPAEDPAVEGYLDIVYTGFVTNRRGLDQVVHAMTLLSDMRPVPRLHVVGSGDHLPVLEKLARDLGVEQHLVCHGWVDHEKLPEFIYRSHIGIIPHPKTGHTDHTIPNKIFDYMAAEKPVIVSNARPLERIARTHDCGLVFIDDDHQSLAGVIRSMADGERRRVMGQNGRRAVLDRYNWAVDFERVLAAVAPFGPGK